MPNYQDVLSQVASLTPTEKLLLLDQLAVMVEEQATNQQQSNEQEFTADPLIGLFTGSPDLASKSEEVLQGKVHLQGSDREQMLVELNEVYDRESSALDPAIAQMQYMSLPREDW